MAHTIAIHHQRQGLAEACPFAKLARLGSARQVDEVREQPDLPRSPVGGKHGERPIMTSILRPASQSFSDGWSLDENRLRDSHAPFLAESMRALERVEPADIGRRFYTEIFDSAEWAKELFRASSIDNLAPKFGRIPLEMLRLIMLPVKAHLEADMHRWALRHVDFGAQREHNDIFEACLLRTLSQCCTREAVVWNSDMEAAWSWVYELVSAILFQELDHVRPLVEAVRQSWQRAITAAAMLPECQSSASGSTAGSSKSRQGKSSSQRVSSSVKGSSMLGSSSAIASGASHVRGKAKLNMSITLDALQMDSAQGARVASVASLGSLLAGNLRAQLPDEGLKFEWSDSHGSKLGGAMELIVSTVTRPQELERALWRMAQKHMELGVDATMLDAFESALFQMLELRLGQTAWDNCRSGWEWLWSVVRQAFVSVLADWESMQNHLADSWTLLQQRAGSVEAVADTFYRRLFEEAPAMRGLFKKRHGTMISSFARALEFVLACAGDSTMLETQLDELALRHCRFDLQSWHFDVFSEVLLNAFAELVGESWTALHTQAWAKLFGSISHVFIDMIEENRCSILSAMVRASPEGVSAALASMPRSRRAATVLATAAGKKSISPLLWALRDGHMQVLQVMLNDLLALRADRHDYYYASDELWRTCPVILRALVEFAPQMLGLFLDGHMWVSRESVQSLRRVNMWIRHLYGDIDVHPDVSDGPVAALVQGLPDSE
eukprot:TRINITY_DN6499_c0_g1_i3.p1 TRINITY_DN6499_c0_g1~~TRINITY_DN6499_c0_g1_i3.p1  ORF type:complete len:745 (-),score=105.69 TRINITY_DN6499_c0_g1_i3:91-2268(-)